MSTKKKVRRQRRERQGEKQGRFNPALAFIAFVVVAIGVIVLIGYFVVDRPEPPWPGAVWSAEHGHWH